MSAWQTPAEEASDAEEMRLCLVEKVLGHIAEPDRDMLDAGARAIEDAFPNQVVSKRFCTDLAARVWRAMFDRVQR